MSCLMYSMFICSRSFLSIVNRVPNTSSSGVCQRCSGRANLENGFERDVLAVDLANAVVLEVVEAERPAVPVLSGSYW